MGTAKTRSIKKAKQMLTVFHESVDHGIQVIGVEEFFELPLVAYRFFKVT